MWIKIIVLSLQQKINYSLLNNRIMITIRDNSTGETFTYHGANKETATSDSFCTLKPTGRRFRQNWNAVVEYYLEGSTFTQCLLRNNFEVIL